MELCTGQVEAVIVARLHANYYRAPSSALLRVPVMSCAHFFTDSYTAGVLALLSASILGVTEGESAYYISEIHNYGVDVNSLQGKARVAIS